MDGQRSKGERVNLPPRIVIGAAQGRSGKTTASIAAAWGFAKRGLSVRPFKKGPDYIDPSWLARASGRECYNLDGFLMPEADLIASFARHSAGGDVAFVEGAMGLFDGFGEAGEGSVAELARLIQAPVILVVNAARMTTSVAALVSGYQHFQPDTVIAGVILNNVAGERHVDKLRRAVETHCGIPVLGTIPKDARLGISERHLGLVPTAEQEEADNVIETICERVESHLDLDGIMEVARSAPAMTAMLAPVEEYPATSCRIGVVRDRAFSFYYPDNLEALRRAGAEVVPVDALGDRALPDVDGLYIGGGFPEIYAAGLEANRTLRVEIARRIDGGLPVYAECAGLMYLCRAITWQGRRYEMAGVIPAEVELTARPQGHGYVEVEVVRENPLFETGTLLRGHEFHHSTLVAEDELPFAYAVRRGRGIDGMHDGVYLKNVFAAYTHLHALGTPEWARRLVALCRKWKETSRPLSKAVDPKRRANHG